ncbi:MAG: MFS transporter [Gammaproteobacteria bacterium]
MSDLNRFNPLERRAAFALALLFFLRMLGLFMLLPVLALYVDKLTHATPSRIGMAIGIYALTQAIFQIPMGRLSDRFGRKPIIAVGLLIFVMGSILAAATHNIIFVIAGRALQGCGAISSAAMALAADLSRESQRTKVMAFIGISIGLAFSTAFVLGPVIDGIFGLSGLFWFVAGLGILGLVVLLTFVPNRADLAPDNDQAGETANVRAQSISRFLSINLLGGFFLHAILAISFVAVPLHLSAAMGLPSNLHYEIYLPVILVSLVAVGPMVMLSNRSGRQIMFIKITIGALITGMGMLYLLDASREATYAALAIFFIGFNYLEVALPSQVSKDAKSGERGQTMGGYATLQFLGTFLGALIGGLTLEKFGTGPVLLCAALVGCAWLLLTLAMAHRTEAV